MKIKLNIAVVTTDPDNDLLKTLNSNYDGVYCCLNFDAALDCAVKNKLGGIMLLADGYPDTTTSITSYQAQKVNESGIRLYIEYPSIDKTLGITGYSGLGKMGYDRAIVMYSSARFGSYRLYAVFFA